MACQDLVSNSSSEHYQCSKKLKRQLQEAPDSCWSSLRCAAGFNTHSPAIHGKDAAAIRDAHIGTEELDRQNLILASHRVAREIAHATNTD